MNLNWNFRQFEFIPVTIQFDKRQFTDVFAQKNNKTLSQTLVHQRYTALAEETCRRYPRQLDTPLGDFLLTLKQDKDQFYMKFLNKYGDLTYSKFWVDDERVLTIKGLYLYLINNTLRYIGRCKDSFKKRINQGYGTIHPKNCFIDGQATNCHINALVTQLRIHITLLVCPLDNLQMITDAEAGLIGQYRPPWNIQGI
jgi:hypothetical protein